MQSLTQCLTEAKSDKYSSLLNLVKNDKMASMVIRRNEAYDKNSISSARKPKFLMHENPEAENAPKEFSFLDISTIDVDDKRIKYIVGIYFDRSYYPLSDNSIVKEIIKKYNSNK